MTDMSSTSALNLLQSPHRQAFSSAVKCFDMYRVKRLSLVKWIGNNQFDIHLRAIPSRIDLKAPSLSALIALIGLRIRPMSLIRLGGQLIQQDRIGPLQTQIPLSTWLNPSVQNAALETNKSLSKRNQSTRSLLKTLYVSADRKSVV